jgi:undecaprenyl-diphosphatase
MDTTTWKLLRKIHLIDVRAFLAINASPRHHDLCHGARLVSRTGDGWLYPLAPLLCLGVEPALAQGFFLALASALLIERLLYLVLKKGLRRNRPPQAIPGFRAQITASDEFSFPSGHTSAAFLFASVCCYCFGPGCAPLFLWAAAVGASRVVLGVHFPTDILAGATMGCSVALAICGELA